MTSVSKGSLILTSGRGCYRFHPKDRQSLPLYLFGRLPSPFFTASSGTAHGLSKHQQPVPKTLRKRGRRNPTTALLVSRKLDVPNTLIFGTSRLVRQVTPPRRSSRHA